MTIGSSRRKVAFGLAAALAAPALVGRAFAEGAANQWFAVTGDDGHPVPNARVPVELSEEMEELPGAIWGGPKDASVTLVEFYDFNCPWCRAADATIRDLMRADRDLRVGLVNNPILSPASAQAAKVELAVLRTGGARTARRFSESLFARKGRIDGPLALDAARDAGLDRAAIERLADGPEIAATLRRQMRLAASMGLSATPSWVAGGAAILGYPGPKALARMVADARSCGTIACPA